MDTTFGRGYDVLRHLGWRDIRVVAGSTGVRFFGCDIRGALRLIPDYAGDNSAALELVSILRQRGYLFASLSGYDHNGKEVADFWLGDGEYQFRGEGDTLAEAICEAFLEAVEFEATAFSSAEVPPLYMALAGWKSMDSAEREEFLKAHGIREWAVAPGDAVRDALIARGRDALMSA